MPASALRKLAKSYASGNLDKETYRKKRAVYLESLLSGKISLYEDVPDTETASRKTPSEDRDPASDTLQNAFEITNIPPARSRRRRSKTTGAWLIGAAVAVLGLVLVLFVSGDNEPQLDTQPESAPLMPAASSPAQDLIASFLEQKKWTQESIAAFLDQWRSISDADRIEAAESVEMDQLANAIHKKLLEERALSGIGNPESSLEKQRQLVRFAAEVGIRDNRITLQE